MPLPWTASMISPAEDVTGAPSMRREVTLDPGHGEVVSAWLHASSLGVFEAFVDGVPAGPDVLSPGWSSYEWRLRYRSYDVTVLARRDVGAGLRARQRLVPRPARPGTGTGTSTATGSA